VIFVAPLEYDAKASKNWKEETTFDASTNHCPERNRGFQINQYGNNSKDWMTRNEIGMGK
jgi:glutamyl-tRNA synthetase